MKTCLICGTTVTFIKFKCQSGYVCKKCYEIVSLNFSQTIKSKNREDLFARYQQYFKQNAGTSNETPTFEITRRISQFLLFDDKQQLICLPNHSKYTKERLQPEIFPFSSIVECQLEEEAVVVNDKVKEEVGTIKLTLFFSQRQQQVRTIWLIAQPIRRDSAAYQMMKKLAGKIVQDVHQLRNEESVC